MIKNLIVFLLLLNIPFTVNSQSRQERIEQMLPETLKKHRKFVSIPNVASDVEDMNRNFRWIEKEFEDRGFEVMYLESSTLPIFLGTRSVDPNAKTILYYFHLDGQAVNPESWDQPDPFNPVLKNKGADGSWETLGWENLDNEINPEWRIFGRAAADDKAPIMMMLTALDLLKEEGKQPAHNLKVILDPQEEAGSEAFLSTLEQYRDKYAADYMIIMDGPAHPTNQPTLTFGCRGIARCSITVYGSKLPQHSGHYGNYSPNPIFTLSHLLASMKDKQGRVLIDNYYAGIDFTEETKAILAAVPDDNAQITHDLYLEEAEKVGHNYQEAMQYPSLNIRHIETSWKGPGLKTIIPEYVTAYMDVRLVVETDGAEQVEKIRKHIEKEGFLVLDRDPTNQERLSNEKIATFIAQPGVNAFRTEIDSEIGKQLSQAIKYEFGEDPVRIRTMGGTVPIIPAINTLEIPAIIVPMVNMDNNQHNPNENIRIGNFEIGIRMCAAILGMELD